MQKMKLGAKTKHEAKRTNYFERAITVCKAICIFGKINNSL